MPPGFGAGTVPDPESSAARMVAIVDMGKHIPEFAAGVDVIFGAAGKKSAALRSVLAALIVGK